MENINNQMQFDNSSSKDLATNNDAYEEIKV
jgi:hypothetical protein